MSIATITWFTIGACLVYIVVQDANVYDFLVLLSKSAGVWVQRQWFRVRYHPDSPWIRYEIKRNSERMTEEFLKQYKQEQENGPSSSD
jgi:uncharacterized membrane protein